MTIALTLMAIPSVRRQALTAFRAPAERTELLSLLADLKAAWNTHAREHIVELAQEQADQLSGAFRWLLRRPEHRYIEQAIDLAGAVKLAAAREELMQLTSEPKLRGRALLAADLIEPLTDDELSELLESPDADMQLTATVIAARRADRPIRALLHLLKQPESKVRAAALAALPAHLPEEHGATLMEIATNRQPEIAVDGLRALAHLSFTTELEEVLVEAMNHANEAIATTAFETMAQEGEPLADETQRQLWEQIEVGNSRRTTALAFLTLERTHSATPGDVEYHALGLNDFGRYFAARLLLSLGAPEGVWQLFDLLGDLDDNQELRFAVMNLLAELANMHVADGEVRLRAWFEANPEIAAQELLAPALDY